MCKEKLITEREGKIIKAALDDSNLAAVPKDLRDEIRASLLKAMLVSALV